MDITWNKYLSKVCNLINEVFKINNYNDHCVCLDSNFQDILNKLNASGLRICFVITMQKNLLVQLQMGILENIY